MELKPIGFIQSDFKEKFGVPRQALMVPEARAILKLNPDPLYRTALQHLDTFSHLWIIFEFHRHLGESAKKDWTPTIRPPRLDAPNRVGVFASRSPDRPNPIGISAVKLEKIDLNAKNGIELHLSGVDLLDQTPVLDIKPYLPYADLIPNATSGWAGSEIKKYPVQSDETLFQGTRENFQTLVHQILEWDPRPTSQREAMPISDRQNEGKAFALRIGDHDIHWLIENQGIRISQIRPISNESPYLPSKG